MVRYANDITAGEFWHPAFVVLNFGLPITAYLTSRRLDRYRWPPHVVACGWQIASLYAPLLLATIPPDEAPGSGDGFVLVPTFLSAAIVLLVYCFIGVWRLCRFRGRAANCVSRVCRTTRQR